MDIIAALKPKTPIEVTVWKDGDDDFEYSFQSTILSITNELFLIEEPENLDPKIYGLLTTGVLIGVVANTKNKPIIFYPSVFSHQKKTPKGFWLKIPADCLSETIQRRGHVRVEMALPITVFFESVGGLEEEMTGKTLDISGGGLKFTSQRAFSSKQDIEIRLNFYPDAEPDEADETLKLFGKIVFSVENQKSTGAGDFYVNAVQFQNLPDKDINKIMGECFKKELEKKRRTKELEL